jgi:hypothetical protein
MGAHNVIFEKFSCRKIYEMAQTSMMRTALGMGHKIEFLPRRHF